MAKIVASKFGNRQLVHLPPVKVSPERADIRVPTLDPTEHYVRDTPSHLSDTGRSDRSVRGYVAPRRQYTDISDDGRRSTDRKPHRHYTDGNLARENSVPFRPRGDRPPPPNDSLIEGEYRIVPQTQNPEGNALQYTQHALAQMPQPMQKQAYAAQAPQGQESQVQYTPQGQGQYTPAPGQYTQPVQGQYAPTGQVMQQQPSVQPSPGQYMYALQDNSGQYAANVNGQFMGQPQYMPVQQPQEAVGIPGNPNEKHIFYGPNGEMLPGPPPGFNLGGSKPRNIDDHPRDFAIDGVCENGTLRSIRLLHGTASFPKIPDFLLISLRQKYKDFPKTDIRIVCRNGEFHVHAVPDIGDSQIPPAIVELGFDPYFMPEQDPGVSRTYGSPPQLERSYPYDDRGDVVGPDPMAPFRWQMSRAQSRPETTRTGQPLPAAVTPGPRQTPAAIRTQQTQSVTPDMRGRPETIRTQQSVPMTRDMWRPTPDVRR